MEWNSTITSMASPTRSRIASKGLRHSRKVAGSMSRPFVASAAASNGHIFIAVMPSASSSSARSPARLRCASRSSSKCVPPSA